MNQTIAAPLPDNIMANNTSYLTSKNKIWKYEAKISALKSYVQCKVSTLHKPVFHKTVYGNF